MSWEDLNDDILADTPIGTLGIIEWTGGDIGIAVMHEDEPTVPKHIIHTIKPGENPLDAIYGKRTFETREVLASYGKVEDARRASQARWAADHRKDTRIAALKLLKKSWDGSMQEAMARLIHLRF